MESAAVAKFARKDITILIVEDDHVSVMAIERALKKLSLGFQTRVAGDGAHALDVLRGTGGEDPLLGPYLILLDINMPRMNGHELLSELRSDPRLRRALVFVLTTSDSPDDIQAAYDRNVAGYLSKDQLHGELLRKIAMIDCYSKEVAFPICSVH